MSDPIVRDFPRTESGYDPVAVDAHLAEIAVRLGRAGADPEGEILAAGRLLLGQIAVIRTELQRLSAALLQQSATVIEALEDLENRAPDEDDLAEEVPEPLFAAEPPPPSPEEAAAREDARLVALDMALGGSGREEIERHLAERFDLADPAGLIDAVLAAIA